MLYDLSFVVKITMFKKFSATIREETLNIEELD